MSKKKITQEILPWDNSELETLLMGIILHGTEVAKIDFKTEIETNTPEKKADLLKDIIAIANTFDDSYEDHGFIIYGVKAKTITGIVQTEPDTDKFQNNIEQLLKTYISPMPQIYVLGFETDDAKKWGAIAIPPRDSKPHMFFKDLSCVDRSRFRKKGEWFVRRGATTDPGLPEDLTLITQKKTELLIEPLRESIRSLQSRVAKIEDQYNSALFKLVERAISAVSDKTEQKSKQPEDLEVNTSDSIDIGELLGMNLSSRLKRRLRTPKDEIAEDLVSEAKTIQDYINGSETGLPWAPQLNNAEGNKKIIEDIEEKIRVFQLSVAIIMLNDHKDIYIDALLRAIKILAKTIEIPDGVYYNGIGKSIRYYPLGLILYTIFVCGVVEDRGEVLKKVLDIPIRHKRREDISHITDIFFFWHDARSLFNDAAGQRRCEPIADRIRQVINDNIGEMITEYSESEYFFRGEFVLALVHIDVCMTNGRSVEYRVPISGLYLYMHEASEAIAGFLFELPDWFSKFYKHPLNEILDMFDRNAHKMAGSGCIAIGINGIKTEEQYQESKKRKAKKIKS